MVSYSSIFPISSGGGGSIAGFEWAEKTADFTAEANKAYYCDTALGDVLMTLPSSPSPGDEVAFLLIGANKLNITTTDKIKGAALATDFVKKTSQQYLLFIFFYVDSTTGWNWDARYDSYIGNAYIGAGDPLANNVILFLKGDGANNSTNIIDSSPTPKTVTRVGDVKISTAQSKYGGSSVYFDGNDYLRIASLIPNGGISLTIEAWVYPTATFSGGFCDSAANTSGSLRHYAGKIERQSGSGVSIAPTLNAWSHIAATYNKTTGILQVFLNGVSQGTANIGTSFTSTNFDIGTINTGLQSLTGYFDSYRVSDVVRYISVFDPETDTYLDV